MELLEALRQKASHLDAQGFADLCPGIYLLGQFPEQEDDDWSFQTRVVRTGSGDAWPAVGEEPRTRPAGWFVRKVEKTDRNSWKRRISIGRATNNDIIIRHPSVSKLHAHFHQGSVGPGEGSTDDLHLSDSGSSNGTKVNGRPVGRGQSVPVASGDKVIFGAVSCTFLDSRRLYRALQTLPERGRAP